MSIADDLNWVVATKPAPPKKTEHSGAKKGKGAWDTKKVAKKTSNKARRAADKQATMGEENDGPFPGAAPLFSAADLNWNQDQALSDPRPCYPSEEAVKDHCNPNISPDSNDNDSYVDEEGYEGGGGDEGGQNWSDPEDMFDSYDDEDVEEEDDWGEQGFEVTEDPSVAPDTQDPDVMDRSEDEGEEPTDFLDPGADPMEAPPDTPSPEQEQWSPEQWKQEVEKDAPAPAPQVDPNDKSRQAPPIPRDPRLGPDEPHQFWSRQDEHIKDALPFLLDHVEKGNPEAQRILMEGPRVGRYDKQSMFETMQNPKFYEKKGTQKYNQQVQREQEKEKGLEPGSLPPLGPMEEDELQKIRDMYYSDDKPENIV